VSTVLLGWIEGIENDSHFEKGNASTTVWILTGCKCVLLCVLMCVLVRVLMCVFPFVFLMVHQSVLCYLEMLL
jgi:hypothetical protein